MENNFVFVLMLILGVVYCGAIEEEEKQDNVNYDTTILNLSGQGWKNLDSIDFNLYPNVEEIDLSSNNLEILREDVFQNNMKLKKLNLANNKDLFLPEYATLLISDIEELNLTGCNIFELPSNIFDGLQNLKIIDIRYNPLKIVESFTFNALQNPQLLYLPSSAEETINEICTSVEELEIIVDSEENHTYRCLNNTIYLKESSSGKLRPVLPMQNEKTIQTAAAENDFKETDVNGNVDLTSEEIYPFFDHEQNDQPPAYDYDASGEQPLPASDKIEEVKTLGEENKVQQEENTSPVKVKESEAPPPPEGISEAREPTDLQEHPSVEPSAQEPSEALPQPPPETNPVQPEVVHESEPNPQQSETGAEQPEAGAEQSQPETAPQEPETSPEQPEASPSQPEASPEQSQQEAAPQEPEMSPEQSESNPPPPEPSPEQSENAPQETEASPRQSESNSLKPESSPEQLEPSPEQSEVAPQQSEISPEQSESNPPPPEPSPEQSETVVQEPEASPKQSEPPSPEQSEVAPQQSEISPEQSESNPPPPESSPGQPETVVQETEASPGQSESNPPQPELSPEQSESNPPQSEPGLEQSEVAPQQSELNPEQSESNPPRPESSPEQAETVVQETEASPGQSESNPPQPELSPEQSESNPPQSEPGPEQSEVAPQQSELNPEQSESNPPPPEPSPEQSESNPSQPEPSPEQSETSPQQPETSPPQLQDVPQKEIGSPVDTTPPINSNGEENAIVRKNQLILSSATLTNSEKPTGENNEHEKEPNGANLKVAAAGNLSKGEIKAEGSTEKTTSNANIFIFLGVAVVCIGLAAFGYRWYKNRTYKAANTEEPVERELKEITVHHNNGIPKQEQEPLMQNPTGDGDNKHNGSS